MIDTKDKKPADFFDIKRPSVTDFVMKKTRAIKAEKAGKILNLSTKKIGAKTQNSYLGKFIFEKIFWEPQLPDLAKSVIKKRASRSPRNL